MIQCILYKGYTSVSEHIREKAQKWYGEPLSAFFLCLFEAGIKWTASAAN